MSGSKGARTSPDLIAACHVLHRLPAPRHPSEALMRLIDLAQTHARGEPARMRLRYDVFISKPTLKSAGDAGSTLPSRCEIPARRPCATRRRKQVLLPWSAIASASGGAGGAGRSRTDDLMLAKHALYQLSYGPSSGAPAVVGPGGLEPPTSRLSGVCSNQLSYRPETITPHALRSRILG